VSLYLQVQLYSEPDNTNQKMQMIGCKAEQVIYHSSLIQKHNKTAN